MQFVKVEDWAQAGRLIEKRLQAALAKRTHVLWLVTGGSNIALSAKIMAKLERRHTKKLAILLSDERYGEVGHVDSNAKQLHDAGFEADDAIFIPPLAPGFSLEETRERYAQACQRAFEHADVVIAQLGIGADGHIAGILPHSAAVAAKGWVTTYETPTYTRVTLTFDALRKIDVAYALAFGAEKRPVLAQLRDEDLSLAEQPSQILKALPEAFIVNDQIGEKEL